MKTFNLQKSLLLSLTTLLLLSSCASISSIEKSEPRMVTHEHKVNAPAQVYIPPASTPVFHDKKGAFSIAADYTSSGNNTNNDPNLDGNKLINQNTTSNQNINEITSVSLNSTYAITEDWSLSGSFQFGNTNEQYTPYVESWQVTDVQATGTYWIWLGEFITTGHYNGAYEETDNYQKIEFDLTRAYSYRNIDFGVAKQYKLGNFDTQILGGLGYGWNKIKGHLPDNKGNSYYASNEIQNINVYVQPAIAYSYEWIEGGLMARLSHINTSVQSNNIPLITDLNSTYNTWLFEPGVFARFGPKHLQFNVSYKWLATINKSPLHFNNGYFSAGVITTFNTRK